jgi:uncharacterized membrane protein YkvA (DUF1232 family)
MNFRIKTTPTTNDLVTIWREGRDDDLVLAVAIAAWAAEKYAKQPNDGVPHVITRPTPGYLSWRYGIY